MLLILISDCSEDCDGGAVVESPSGECNSFAKIVKNNILRIHNFPKNASQFARENFLIGHV